MAVVPCLCFNGTCEDAIATCARAFGGEIIGLRPLPFVQPCQATSRPAGRACAVGWRAVAAAIFDFCSSGLAPRNAAGPGRTSLAAGRDVVLTMLGLAPATGFVRASILHWWRPSLGSKLSETPRVSQFQGPAAVMPQLLARRLPWARSQQRKWLAHCARAAVLFAIRRFR